MVRRKKIAGDANDAGKNVKLSRLEPTASAACIHAEGEWLNGGGERRGAASIGPEVGNVTAMQVENTTRAATRA